MEQEELLRALARLLKRLKIPYLVTGGIAVVVWGRPRFTADIDIVIELKTDQIDSLSAELLKIDKEVYLDKDEILYALKTRGEFGFLHAASGLRVDFWILKDNAFDRERIRRRIKKTIAGVPIYFSSPEDLILIKLLWSKESGSSRQLDDVRSILRIQNKLDFYYLRKWAKIHGTLETLNSLIKDEERN